MGTDVKGLNLIINLGLIFIPELFVIFAVILQIESQIFTIPMKPTDNPVKAFHVLHGSSSNNVGGQGERGSRQLLLQSSFLRKVNSGPKSISKRGKEICTTILQKIIIIESTRIHTSRSLCPTVISQESPLWSELFEVRQNKL